MARPVTLFTGQWADLSIETMCQKAKSFGYDGVELACWGDHFEVDKALAEIESQAGLQFCQRLTEVFLSDARACYAELAEAQAIVALAGQPVAEPVGSRAE